MWLPSMHQQHHTMQTHMWLSALKYTLAKWKSGWTVNAIKDPVNMIDMTEKQICTW